ncbi:MAG: hypothetical protein II915_01705 [Eubacterium sp.]|nr:hypothetical protein [Eubacterium sp.]
MTNAEACDKLEKLLFNSGVSLKRACDEAGVPYSTIRDDLKKKSNLDFGYLTDICEKVLHISLSNFCRADDSEEYVASVEEKAVLEKYHQVDHDYRPQVMAYFQALMDVSDNRREQKRK